MLLALVLLNMPGPTRAQPVDIPPTWGTSGLAPAHWQLGGLRDALGKQGVGLDVDLLPIINQALEKRLDASGNALRETHTAVVRGVRAPADF